MADMHVLIMRSTKIFSKLILALMYMTFLIKQVISLMAIMTQSEIYVLHSSNHYILNIRKTSRSYLG